MIDIVKFSSAGLNDYGPPLQDAIDSLRDDNDYWPPKSGGRIHFPARSLGYPIKTPVTVNCGGITISGEGSHNNFACVLYWRGENRDEALFNFVAPTDRREQSTGFSMKDIKLFGGGATQPQRGSVFRFSNNTKYTASLW
ncbi:hypothetical protein LCGC14_1774990, partial [marine sediment metagenome]